MARKLLSVVELGGYPSFNALYRASGFEVVIATSLRKALSLARRDAPDVVAAEFNFQSDFRDRTSNLESLLATLQTCAPGARVIVFYEPDHRPHLERLQARFRLFEALPFPIQEEALRDALERAALR
jgi:DNA-binding NtrC family response regulator